jgi:type IV pilus assembly protein PilA
MQLRDRTQKEKGQGLTEYLILLCLVAVSAIAVVSVVGQNLRARYATISSALRGDREVKKEMESPEAGTYQLRGFDDYTDSATSKGGGRGW